ncbi:hypothetical protein Cni_G26364 [Canna indica]|uniref:Tetrapyrrole methylase domain-containing protein n=1 Tax=Canna indica TaxID=4628 RepID=A0AAQ3QLY8_9LILI|nr:hypothetical protein Cni_G26364 [Canna indica]
MLPLFPRTSSAITRFLVPAPSSSPHLLYSLRNPPFSSRFLRFSSSTSDANSLRQHQQEDLHGHGGSSKAGLVKSGLYLVATPIGNREDITLRALRILKSADIILSEDTRHSRKLLQYYEITTPLLSYHKFNESERESSILERLRQGEVIALISDAGTPCISDPGMELAKVCVTENIPVVPIPGPSAVVCALSASGLSTDEFKFVGFLPKHTGSRREKLQVAAAETATQIFYVPPHKLQLFLEEASLIFGDSRLCVIAREMTKIHEEFRRGTLGEASKLYSTQQPKGEMTVLIQGNTNVVDNVPSDDQLKLELNELINKGHSLSMAVKLVAVGTSAKRKHVYALALKLSGKLQEGMDDSGQKSKVNKYSVAE